MKPSLTILAGLGLVAGCGGLWPLAARAASPTTIKSSPAAVAKPASAPSSPLLPGAGSKEPINIDAARLDYYDKEQKLVYTGGVVAVQGDSTLKSSVLTILLQKDPQGAAAPGAAPPAAGGAAAPAMGPGAGSSVKHMEADGPVTLISKDQIGTGDHATYDKGDNKVYLNGHVTLSQGTNVTQGDRLVYDMTSGQAQVFSKAATDRVHSVFTPGTGATPDAKPAPAPVVAKTGKAAPAPKRKTVKAPADPARDAAAQR